MRSGRVRRGGATRGRLRAGAVACSSGRERGPQMAIFDDFAVGARVALDLSGILGRVRRDWRELSEYERAAWLVFDEFARRGAIWDED